MTPAEAQPHRDAFARITFRRGYRLLRRIAQGDEAAIRERDVLVRTGRLDLFWARIAMLNRNASDPLTTPLQLRRWLRECTT
jgi:hypothetical protein